PMPSKQRAAPHQAASTEQRSGEPQSSEHRAVERRATEQRAAGTPPVCANSNSAAASHSLAASSGAAGSRPSAGAPRRALEGGQQASKLPTPGNTPASSGERPVEWWRAVDGWRAPPSREASSDSDDEHILPEQRPAAHQHLFLTGSFSELWRSQRHADLSPSLAASCLCMVSNLHRQWL
ncbi:hypothetical protein Dimus_010668, partial [Dionaea muscipula]